MIYPLAGLLIGAILGMWRAKANGGRLADLVQWAAVFAIMGGIIGLFVLIGIERSLV